MLRRKWEASPERAGCITDLPQGQVAAVSPVPLQNTSATLTSVLKRVCVPCGAVMWTDGLMAVFRKLVLLWLSGDERLASGGS